MRTAIIAILLVACVGCANHRTTWMNDNNKEYAIGGGGIISDSYIFSFANEIDVEFGIRSDGTVVWREVGK